MPEPDVLELTRRLKRTPNINTALHIMQWELGDLAKSYIYTTWHSDPLQNSAWLAEARKALGSLLFQAEVIAQLLGTTSKDAFNFGVMEVEDRIVEVEKGHAGRFRCYKGEGTNG